MYAAGKHFVAMASLPFVTLGMALPAPVHAADTAPPAISAAPAPEASPAAAPLGIAAAAPLAVDGDPAARAVFLAAAAITWDSPAPAPSPAATETSATESAAVDPDLECMAKVVHHEARNQSHRGQLAVAQLIMNRIHSGRFAGTACAVANQPGQFFHTASYNPPRDSADWANAVQVAREARDRSSDEVAPGALFFHAAYASTSSFFRSRQRVATLGDHIFYR